MTIYTNVTEHDPRQAQRHGKGRTPFTSHAQNRSKQRSIPPLIADLLQDYGSAFRSGDADVLIFDKAAMKRLRYVLGGDRGVRTIERWLKAYAVVGDDGQLVTIGYRVRRLRRH